MFREERELLKQVHEVALIEAVENTKNELKAELEETKQKYEEQVAELNEKVLYLYMNSQNCIVV